MKELCRIDASLGETADDLIALAVAHHVPLNRHQLRRLSRAGVIPPPKQDYPHGKRGSQTVYPQGTGELLLALGKLPKQVRPLQERAWQVWWQGKHVPMATIREYLDEVVNKWEREVGKLINPKTGRLSRQARTIIHDVATQRTDYKIVRQARKRVGSISFSTFASLLLQMAGGIFQGFQGTDADAKEEQKIVEKGLGLMRARKDHIAGTEPWLTGDLGDALVTLSALLADAPWRATLSEATESDLLQARDELRLVLAAVESFSQVVEEVFGPGAFGLGAFGRAIGEMKSWQQALLLLLWYTLHCQGFGTSIDTMSLAAQHWLHQGLVAYQALQHIQVEIPAAAEVLSAQRWKAALQSAQAQERHLLQVQDFYQHHQDEFLAFWRRHPELQTCL